jgi:UDP-N-acetylmuramoyl-tripeptide--D-alanyl-D-alanine ligase
MHKLNTLFSIIFPLVEYTYLLQLEEYDSLRYAKLLPRFFFRRNLQIRSHLDYTARAKLTLFLAGSLLTLSSILITFCLPGQSLLQRLVIFLAITIFNFSLLTPLYIYLSNALLAPLVTYQSHRILNQATKKIQKLKDTKIIAITGSYGKTTVKMSLQHILQKQFRIQVTPGNINTPLGIAQWVLGHVRPHTQYLIVEMDAYRPREIQASCAITPPSMALITNFGDQHLERFGSHEILTLSYLEVVTSSPITTTYIPSEELQKAQKYDSAKNILKNCQALQISKKMSKFITPLESYAEFERNNILYAVFLALELQVPQEIILEALRTLQLPERRGDRKQIFGVEVIDRSYNISENTATQGLLAAAMQANKSKRDLILITAGIPERGTESYEVNKKYGQIIKDYPKHIIILQSIYAPAITEGIAGHSSIYYARTMSEALQAMKNITSKNPEQYLVLMQPELTDLSY